MNKGLIKLLLAFGLSLFLTFSYLFLPSVFVSLDNRLRDFMFIIRGEIPINDNIVVVDIDEKSLKTHGQWPWSRDKVAELIDKLSSYSPGIIGLDIVFAESDRSSPHLLENKFPNMPKNLPNNDAILAHTFQNTPVVGGYIFTFQDTNKTIIQATDAPMIPAVVVQQGLKNNHSILSPSNTVLNTPLLQDALYSSGFFNNIPDDNGMIRRVPLVMKYDHTIFTSLSLEMVRIYSNHNRINILGDEYGIYSVNFGIYNLPVDHVGQFIVNFRGESHTYPYISAADILNNSIKKSDIQNKFVLIGTSALGLYDLRATPYDSNIPGVEIHANVIDNLLTGDYLYQPLDHVLYNVFILWFLIFTLMLLWNFIRSIYTIPLSLILFYAISYLFYTLLFSYGLVLNLLFPLLAFVFTLIGSIAIDYTISFRQKEEAKKILGKKVSTSVMNHLIKHVDEGLVTPKEVEATIFFSDIIGFTSISEHIGSPDRLIKMLNTYMTPMVESIISHQGTIDKFIGDAVMAYWNAPIEVTNHADKAVQSAIEQIESLSSINKIIKPKYNVTINIGIGLHTGIVTAGDMGAEGRSDYTVIGDNVNLASRLEGLTRYYDVQILISQATYKALKQSYNIRPIDIVEVKGKSKAVEIYEIVCNTKNINEEESKLYEDAINAYRSTNIKEANSYFTTLTQKYPSVLYAQYLNRCQYYIEHPQENFTPVLQMKTK